MTNLPKKLTFAYDYIIKKKQQQSQMLRNGNMMISDKRARCGPVWTLATSLPPCGAAIPQRAVGSMPGMQGSLGLQLQPCCLSPYTRCRGHSPNAELWGLAMGLQRISGTFLEPQGQLGSKLLTPGCKERVDLLDAPGPMDPNTTYNCCAHMSLMVAGIPAHRSHDNLHSVWGHGVRGGCGGRILVDAWWMPHIHWDVSREGTRAAAEACCGLLCGVAWLTAKEMQTDAP